MNLHNLAGKIYVEKGLAAVAANAATAFVSEVMNPYSEGKATLAEAWYIPTAAITGTNTDSRTINLKLKGGTVIASLAFISGVNGVAHTRQAFTLVGTAAQLLLAIGDVLVIENALVGTNGLVLPVGTVVLGFTGAGG